MEVGTGGKGKQYLLGRLKKIYSCPSWDQSRTLVTRAEEESKSVFRRRSTQAGAFWNDLVAAFEFCLHSRFGYCLPQRVWTWILTVEDMPGVRHQITMATLPQQGWGMSHTGHCSDRCKEQWALLITDAWFVVSVLPVLAAKSCLFFCIYPVTCLEWVCSGRSSYSHRICSRSASANPLFF